VGRAILPEVMLLSNILLVPLGVIVRIFPMAAIGALVNVNDKPPLLVTLNDPFAVPAAETSSPT
jgi:hypothetical protein